MSFIDKEIDKLLKLTIALTNTRVRAEIDNYINVCERLDYNWSMSLVIVNEQPDITIYANRRLPYETVLAMDDIDIVGYEPFTIRKMKHQVNTYEVNDEITASIHFLDVTSALLPQEEIDLLRTLGKMRTSVIESKHISCMIDI